MAVDGTSTPRDNARATVAEAGTYNPTVQTIPTVQGPTIYDRYSDVTVNAPRDAVRWGPVIAGLIAALTTMLLLNLLGLALGLSSVDAAGAARAGTNASEAAHAGTMTAIWAGVAGIIGFFVGGYLAGKTSAVQNKNSGALNGALVFMLAVPLTLWLAGAGLGSLLGSLGNLTSALNVSTVQLQSGAQQAIDAARNAAAGVSQSDVASAAQTAKATTQTAAWSALIGSLLALGAATLGGTVGARHSDESTER